MTLTTDELRQIVETDHVQCGDAAAMARELLANREAQPVALVDRRPAASGSICWQKCGKDLPHGTELFTAPPAPANANPVAWEMRYWNSGHNMWHDWERITAEQHAEMSVQHAADNDYEFRVLYDVSPAPAVPDDYQHLKNVRELYHKQEERLFSLAQRIKGASFDKYSHVPSQAIDVLEREIFGDDGDACRAAMLAQPVSSGYTLPEGFKLVPVEPTEEMLRAAYRESGVYSAKAYRAMLASAPEGGNGA
ncbi:hypothetical protein [Serratia bockelmannii]|uniref:hypothetical protein n=1 Tax=Serratia bockelmannii TaxID=2703793 RepID=UPI00313C7359